jgi:hypothetical protein
VSFPPPKPLPNCVGCTVPPRTNTYASKIPNGVLELGSYPKLGSLDVFRSKNPTSGWVTFVTTRNGASCRGLKTNERACFVSKMSFLGHLLWYRQGEYRPFGPCTGSRRGAVNTGKITFFHRINAHNRPRGRSRGRTGRSWTKHESAHNLAFQVSG